MRKSKPVVPTEGMVINTDTVLRPGVYMLPQGITIAADGVTLDGSQALLLGSQRQGRGLTLQGVKGVTVKNLRLAEYEHGIHAHQCTDLEISGCQITSTSEVDHNSIFLDIWLPAEKAYGGGILLWDVSCSRITKNDLSHQMNGLLTYHCHDLTVHENLANYCSGFGFHLYNTCDSLFEDNFADFCCRYQPRGERYGHMGADATGFLIVYSSCQNVFRNNFARLGGDGFFLAGLTPDFEPVGCDDNLFEGNDGSYSPNIAFEGTFSRGNRYLNNLANHCNYGFWMGFSRQFTLDENQMIGNNQAGIAVENGFGFKVRNNTFQDNGHGVLLWSKHIPGFARAVPDNDTSYDWLIERNTFTNDGKAIRIVADQDHGIRPLPASGEWGTPAPAPHDHTIRNNQIQHSRVGIELIGVKNSVLDNNNLDHNINDLVEKAKPGFKA
jgi:parallel beta-helix repeat protein